jgi:hypothetical protein
VDPAALHAGVTRRHLRDAARQGEITHYVFKRGSDGRATVIAFDPRDLDAWIELHRVDAHPFGIRP